MGCNRKHYSVCLVGVSQWTASWVFTLHSYSRALGIFIKISIIITPWRVDHTPHEPNSVAEARFTLTPTCLLWQMVMPGKQETLLLAGCSKGRVLSAA
ncbi:hypothetical protein AFLA_008930 [Aspergillus flavus NRRL3357]|nr:hypothetical protein AFLA_008930 [Aspergillus flavus NRRL3357]